MQLPEIPRVAREQRGGPQARAGANLDRPAVQRGGRAVTDDKLLQHRLVDAAEDGLAAAEQTDERAPEWDAGDESLGAVDRIEHPHELGVGALVAVFLADDAVVG